MSNLSLSSVWQGVGACRVQASDTSGRTERGHKTARRQLATQWLPWARHRLEGYETFITLSRLVPPGTPIGRPATSTTMLPGPAAGGLDDLLFAASKEVLHRLEALDHDRRYTPPQSKPALHDLALGSAPRSETIGRYLETLAAVLPDSVKATMRLAPSWWAVRQAS